MDRNLKMFSYAFRVGAPVERI